MTKSLLYALLFLTIVSSGAHRMYAMRRLPPIEAEMAASSNQEIEELEDLSAVHSLPDDAWFAICVFLPVYDLKELHVASRDMNHKVRTVMEQLFGENSEGIRFTHSYLQTPYHQCELDLEIEHVEQAWGLYLSSLSVGLLPEKTIFYQAIRFAEVGAERETYRRLVSLRHSMQLAVLFAKNRGRTRAEVLLKKHFQIINEKLEALDRASGTFFWSPWRQDVEINRRIERTRELKISLFLGLSTCANKILSSPRRMELRSLLKAAKSVVRAMDDVNTIRFLCEDVRIVVEEGYYVGVGSESYGCTRWREAPSVASVWRGEIGRHYPGRLDGCLKPLSMWRVAKECERACVLRYLWLNFEQTLRVESYPEKMNFGAVGGKEDTVCCIVS